jgi:signal transduction histidine kinase
MRLWGTKGLLSDFQCRRNERRLKRQAFIREFIRQHMEYHRQQKIILKADNFQKQLDPSKFNEFQHYNRRLKYIRPVFIIINLVLWYLIIRYMGIGIFGIFIAAILSIWGVYEIFFLWRLEKRVFNPIDQLKKGVEEIARGNYGVRIECDVLNDITLLVASFNQMAQKLREGEKIKAEYEENRKDLLANISHDLKTPITSIQGYIEAILDRTDLAREDVQYYLQIIYNNTAYLNKLIDDLFLFSKLDMDKLEFKFEKIPFRNFMNDLMEELGLELAEKQIEFSYHDNLALECMVNIDRKRIHQAVRNIIGNAIKHGPETGLMIDTAISRQNNQVIIEIRDNGPGIPAEKLPFIFERFYRIDAERTKDVVSTGLGLAITRELVEAHGGRISVSSVLNTGSCFTIELPLVEGLGENEI